MAYVQVDETVLRKYMERTVALELELASFRPMFAEWQRFKDEDALRKAGVAESAEALDPLPFPPSEISTNPNHPHPAPEHPRDEHGRFLPTAQEPDDDDDSADR